VAASEIAVMVIS